MITLEICTGSIQSVVNAHKGGADRIELCSNLEQGGTTPSKGFIDLAIQYTHLEIAVLIRPREGNFVYNSLEKEIMREDIQYCCTLDRVKAIVVGALLEDNTLDINMLRGLRKVAGPKDIVFHRAFDQLTDPLKAIDQLTDEGFVRILTSGKAKSAYEGSENLKKYIEYSGERISIMPGGGITPKNARDIVIKTGAMEVHSSAKELIQPLPGTLDVENGFNSYYQTNKEIVRQLRESLI